MFTKVSLIGPRVQHLRNASVLFSSLSTLAVKRFKLDAKYGWLNCRRKIKMDLPVLKPPNVLVYTGENFNSGDPAFYRNVAKNINACLQSDCYTIYLLTPLQVVNDPWEENLKLLVISCDSLTDDVAESFRKYALNGGKVLNFGGNLKLPGLLLEEKNINSFLAAVDYEGHEISLYSCKHSFEFAFPHTVLCTDTEGNSRIIKIIAENSIIVMSDVHLEIDSNVLDCDKQLVDMLKNFNDSRIGILRNLLSVQFELSCSTDNEKLDLTVGFLVTKDKIDSLPFDNSSQSSFKKLGIKFIDFADQSSLAVATEKELPVLYNCPEKKYPTDFNKEVYFSNLKTNWMGQMVFFVEVVGTTMAVAESLPNVEGAVVVANRQLLGKGRRGNCWITPVGSLAFSAQFSVPLQSPLGQKLPIVQYFAVLSLVKAIRETPGYEDLDVQIKWPNDIYYEGQSKIGGVIVNSTITASTVHIYTGSGLNVNNSKPTICVNEIIKSYNSKTGKNLPTFSSEELVARSLNELEQLILNYQDNNSEYFFSAYYKYWMHGGQKVSLNGQKGFVTIVGIDQYGFLMVETENKKKIALQPDGNSFDIMKNLIVVREMCY